MDQVKATHNTTSSTKRSYVEIEGDQRTTDALARGMTGNADTEQRDDAKDPQTTKAPKRRTVHRITVDPTDQPSTPIIVQEFPLTYWLDKYNDGKLPELPPVGDCELLFDIWENVATVETRSKKITLKGRRFATLGRLGDAWIRLLSLELLPRIFGADNDSLVTLLQNHANSNKFFDQIAQYYGLDKRVNNPPEKEIDGGKEKGASDILEAWIGCHIKESQLYYRDDPLHEVRSFFNQLWSLRYRDLKVYASQAYISKNGFDNVQAQEVGIEKISWPDDDLLQQNLASLDRLKQKFQIGGTITGKDGRKYFIPGRIPENVTRWSTCNWSTDVEVPLYNPPSNLFRCYQLKSSTAIQKALLLAQSSEVIDWKSLIHDYKSWIQELSSLSSQSHLVETKVMLQRQLAYLYFRSGDFRASYLEQGKVLIHAASKLPTQTYLMTATLDQIQVITSQVDVDCTVSINKDYTSGEISPAKILPVLRWNAVIRDRDSPTAENQRSSS